MKKHETARIICEKIAALQGQRLRGHGRGSAETRFAPGPGRGWARLGVEGIWELTPRNSLGQEESLESNFFQFCLSGVF